MFVDRARIKVSAGAGGNGGLLFLGSGCVNGSTGLDGINGSDGVNGSGTPLATGFPNLSGPSPFWQADSGAAGTSGQNGSHEGLLEH